MSNSYSLSFTNGYIVFVEGNDPSGNEWWLAHEWQKDNFLEAMRFGEMKTMGGCYVPDEKTEPFYIGNFKYRFIIENEWGPCYLHNMTTDKKRRIKYINLGNCDSDIFPEDKDNIKSIVSIKKF
jgi:hypothetical protein